jgi:hypothetical protein
VSRTSKSVVTNSHNHFGEGMSDVERKKNKRRKIIKIKIPVTQAICNHKYPQPSLKEKKRKIIIIIPVSRTSNM